MANELLSYFVLTNLTSEFGRNAYMLAFAISAN